MPANILQSGAGGVREADALGIHNGQAAICLNLPNQKLKRYSSSRLINIFQVCSKLFVLHNEKTGSLFDLARLQWCHT